MKASRIVKERKEFKGTEYWIVTWIDVLKKIEYCKTETEADNFIVILKGGIK